jgi:5-dehydro-2-deoxygluconokinase
VIEALVVGRVGVDFTPATPRTTLAAADSFVRAVGGFAGNIATGLARLGIGTAVLSAVGDDGHGDHVRAFLAGEGVDVASIVTRPGSRTQVAFVEAWPPDRFPVTFYRAAPAPEMQLAPAELPTGLLEEAPLVILSGALLAGEPARSTVRGLLEDRRASRGLRPRSVTLLDLDWRPTLWDRPEEAPALLEEVVALSDVVIGSDDEFEAAHLRPEIGTRGGAAMIVLKHGPDGVSLVTEHRRRSLAGIPVEVVCGTGSGDALAAAFAAGLLRGLDPFVAVERGSAAGAIVASRLMCSTAMPTPEEIDRLLAGRSLEPQVTLP